MTAGDIAEVSGLTRKTVYNNIDDVLEFNDRIHTENIGGSNAYWWEPEVVADAGLTPEGRDYYEKFRGFETAYVELRSKVYKYEIYIKLISIGIFIGISLAFLIVLLIPGVV